MEYNQLDLILTKIPKGKRLTVKENQVLVEKQCIITQDDWQTHKKSRKTRYPKWKAQIQAKLYQLKKGIVLYDDSNYSYKF